MAGYNHYPDCSCGWCVNYGRSRTNRFELTESFQCRDARVLLKQSNANSVSGCFVNSNARCPDCGAPVFFYANASGGKVYFDDLGPPWPKHPCTDRSRYKSRSSIAAFGAPTRRSRGQVIELLNAAYTAGLSRYKVFGRRRPEEWTLIVVQSVERRGDENRVEGEFLDSDTTEQFRFTCRSAMPLFEAGDFVSVRGSEISFVDRDTLQPVVFVSGGWVERATEPIQQALTSPPAATPKAPAILARRTIQGQLIRKVKPASKTEAPKYDMTKAEMVHFDSKKVPFAELFGRLEPIVKSYARAGTRKPRDVAARLNIDGHRTAFGEKWTPRLVYFLLALMFNDTPTSWSGDSDRKDEERRKSASPKPQHTAGSSKPLNTEIMAERLSRLGRVVRSRKAG